MPTPFDKTIMCPETVGREPQLATLKLALMEAQQGLGQIVLLAGEAGIGKSRLVAEVKAEAVQQGFRLLQGICFEPDRFLPYAPLLDLLRNFREVHPPTTSATAFTPFAAEFSKLLPELDMILPDGSSTPPLDPEPEKRRLFHTFTQFFLQQPPPILMLIEDIHWSDDTSLEFLRSFARRITPQPLLLVLTYRPDESHLALQHFLADLDRSRLGTELTLDRLSASDVEQMIGGIFDQARPIRAEFVASLHALTDGNPFFVEEILKALIVSGEVFYAGHEWQRKPLHVLRMPRTVQAAVQQRVQKLSAAASNVLTLAAMMGRRFDVGLLPLLTGQTEDALLPLLKELIGAQLVVEESADHFAFRHALTRQAIVTSLLARERQRIHRVIGTTMEQRYAAPAQRDAHLADLAYHFYEAGAWPQALEYTRRAGEKAQRFYAPRAAAEQFSRAVHAARQIAEQGDTQKLLCELYRSRGQAYETLGDFELAQADFEQVMEFARMVGDRHAEWQSLIDLGFLWASRNYLITGDFFRQALALAQSMDDPHTLGHSLNRLGNWLANVGQPHASWQHHETALAIFESLDDPQGFAQTLDLLGTANYMAGDLVQGTVHYLHAVELFRVQGDRSGLASSLANLAMRASIDTVAAAGTLEEAVRDGEQAIQISHDIGWRSNEALSQCMLAQALSQQGNFAQALQVGHTALALADEIEHRLWMIYARATVGTIYTLLLDGAAARCMLEEALQMAQILGSPTWLALASACLATIYIAERDFDQAEAVLDAALPPGQPAETLAQQWVEAVRAELALARGDALLALHRLEGLLSSVPHLAGERVAPQIARLRGESFAALGRLEEAEAELRAAEAETRRRGANAPQWQIHRALGYLYKQQNQPREAEQAFAIARTLVETLAANILDPAMRSTFSQRALALLPAAPVLNARQAAKQAWAGLTDREREVAALIAQGKSNREIATALMVGTKTVEAHISRILSKLGYTSRVQIATWVVEKGHAQAAPDQVTDA